MNNESVIGLTILVVALVILIVVAVEYGRRHDHVRRTHLVGPYCAHTRWGCCPDGSTVKEDPRGTNCVGGRHLIGGCAGTRWGCCPGSHIARANRRGTNCPVY